MPCHCQVGLYSNDSLVSFLASDSRECCCTQQLQQQQLPETCENILSSHEEDMVGCAVTITHCKQYYVQHSVRMTAQPTTST